MKIAVLMMICYLALPYELVAAKQSDRIYVPDEGKSYVLIRGAECTCKKIADLSQEDLETFLSFAKILYERFCVQLSDGRLYSIQKPQVNVAMFKNNFENHLVIERWFGLQENVPLTPGQLYCGSVS